MEKEVTAVMINQLVAHEARAQNPMQEGEFGLAPRPPCDAPTLVHAVGPGEAQNNPGPVHDKQFTVTFTT